MTRSATLHVRNLVVQHTQSDRPAVDRVSFDVSPRRTTAIIGPSGAGKTSLLRAIAGLTTPSSGSIAIGDRRVEQLTPQERRIAMVFQTDALFEHMSVRGNLSFALRGSGDASRVDELAAALQITEHLQRSPRVLSGGERQRVAIARAVLSDPEVLLLDEPLAHLDPELRARVRKELLGVRERFDGPIVYVTHDHAEALAIADELLVLMDGVVEDAGDPQRVYDAPATMRAAAFLGERPMNLIRTSPDEYAGIRPEHIEIERNDAASHFRGQVTRIERTGADVFAYVWVDGRTLVVRARSSAAPTLGETIGLRFDEPYVRRYRAADGKAIS